jgi:lysophospholipase L1-like esterase
MPTDTSGARDLAERRRTLRGLLSPNPSNGRLLAPLGVMANPPVVTPGSASGATTITNSVLVDINDSRFTKAGVYAPAGSGSPDNSYNSPAIVADWGGTLDLYQAGPFAREFVHYGQAFELRVKGTGAGGRYRLTVHGEGYDAQIGRGDTAANGSAYLIHYDFGSVALRRIRFDFAGSAYFGGIRIAPTDALLPSPRPLGPKVVVIGDSFIGGAINVTGLTTWWDMAARLLGWWDVAPAGAGGTGYVADNLGTRTDYETRIVNDALQWNPDILVISGGINDSATAQATVLAAARSLFANIRTESPDTILIVDGIQWTNGYGAPILQRDAIRQAAREYAHCYIEQIGGPYPYSGTIGDYSNAGWMTGQGKVGATVGDGNSDVFRDTDGTHPTQAGQDFRGAHFAADVAAWFDAGAPMGAMVFQGAVSVS